MDQRIKKNTNASRESRSAQDRSRAAPEEGFATTKERRRFRNEFQQVALPTIPDIPGYHLCWLATNSQYDPLHRRLTMGYTPVLAEEMPGYEMYRVKDGDQTGHIVCNEMLLCKMPMELYQDIMLEHHHYAPMDEAEKLNVQQEQLVSKKDSSGKQLVTIEGGIQEDDVRTPSFS